MRWGEGTGNIIFAAAVMALAVWLFVLWFEWISREWQALLAEFGEPPYAKRAREEYERQLAIAELQRAEAIVPEVAAARMGGCTDCFGD